MEPSGGGANLGWRRLGAKTIRKQERQTVEERYRTSRPPPLCVSPRCRRRRTNGVRYLTVPLLLPPLSNTAAELSEPRQITDYPTRANIEDHHITAITDSAALVSTAITHLLPVFLSQMRMQSIGSASLFRSFLTRTLNHPTIPPRGPLIVITPSL